MRPRSNRFGRRAISCHSPAYFRGSKEETTGGGEEVPQEERKGARRAAAAMKQMVFM